MLFKIFDWIAASRTIQFVLLAIGVLLGLKAYGVKRYHDGKNDGKQIVHKKAQKKLDQTREIIDETDADITAELNRRELRELAAAHRRNRLHSVR